MSVFQDIRHGLRVLLKSRSFTLIAVLTLSLGIGASTAVFSVVNTILLKPLPYPEAQRIVIPWKVAPRTLSFDYDVYPWGPDEFRVLRTLNAFEHFGVFKAGSFNLTGSADPVLLKGLLVSSGFFPALGIQPELGRFFTREEDTPGREGEVILSDQLWRERFNADSAILGRAIALNGAPHVVVGVMPPTFSFPRAEEMPGFMALPRRAQLWVPIAVPPAHGPKPEPSELASVARLAPGWTISNAQSELAADFTARLERQYPQWKGYFDTRITPLAEQVTGNARRPLLLTLGAVSLVLLIATANVANLLLARSISRKREFTVRAALGAGYGRLVRQLLTESALLAVASGLCGVAVGNAGVELAKAFGPANLTHLQDVALDWQAFAFALGIAVAAGMLFGIAPAIWAARADLAESLKEAGTRSVGSQGRSRFRGALVVSEVALSMLLVIAAGLLTRTVREMLRSDPGFRPDHVLTFELALPESKYPDQTRMSTLWVRIAEKLRSQPGVVSAGVGQVVPLGGSPDSTTFHELGRPVPAIQKEVPYADYTLVTPGYFPALGVPLLAGRDFLASDTADSTRVVVINAAMAKRYFAGEDPLGKQIDFANSSFPPMTIVGIIGTVKQGSLREPPQSHFYAPFTQRTWTPMQTVQTAIRTTSDPSGAAAYARETIRSVDPDLPLAKLETMEALIDDSMTQPRFAMLLLSGFGVLALVLASIGMYGVISCSVAQRTWEIGVRMAIGASRPHVFRMVIGEGVRLAGAGIAIGIVLALLLTRLMANELYEVKAADPLTFATVSFLLAIVALAASYVPARRATRVDPLSALRHD